MFDSLKKIEKIFFIFLDIYFIKNSWLIENRVILGRLGNSCTRSYFFLVSCRIFFLCHVIFKILYRFWHIFFYPFNFNIFVYPYCVHFLSMSCNIFYRILIIFCVVFNLCSCRITMSCLALSGLIFLEVLISLFSFHFFVKCLFKNYFLQNIFPKIIFR